MAVLNFDLASVEKNENQFCLAVDAVSGDRKGRCGPIVNVSRSTQRSTTVMTPTDKSPVISPVGIHGHTLVEVGLSDGQHAFRVAGARSLLQIPLFTSGFHEESCRH